VAGEGIGRRGRVEERRMVEDRLGGEGIDDQEKRRWWLCEKDSMRQRMLEKIRRVSVENRHGVKEIGDKRGARGEGSQVESDLKDILLDLRLLLAIQIDHDSSGNDIFGIQLLYQRAEVDMQVILFKFQESIMEEMHDAQSNSNEDVFHSQQQELENVEGELSGRSSDETSGEPIDGVAIAKEIIFL
jgi:hypothetical protein